MRSSGRSTAARQHGKSFGADQIAAPCLSEVKDGDLHRGTKMSTSALHHCDDENPAERSAGTLGKNFDLTSASRPGRYEMI